MSTLDGYRLWPTGRPVLKMNTGKVCVAWSVQLPRGSVKRIERCVVRGVGPKAQVVGESTRLAQVFTTPDNRSCSATNRGSRMFRCLA